jgi:hypothetical protein
MRLSRTLMAGAILVAMTLVAADRVAGDALPGDVSESGLLEGICARVAQACAKTAGDPPCKGVGTGCPTDPVTGTCFPYTAGPPEFGANAFCDTCTGLQHNTCSGAALPPPPAPQCWETTAFCCNLTSQCKPTVAGCECVATALTQARNTRIVCWMAPPTPAGGQPAPPDPIPEPDDP